MRNFCLLLLLFLCSSGAWARKPVPDTLLMDLRISETTDNSGGSVYLVGSYITIYQHGKEIGVTDTSETGTFSIALVLLDTGCYTLVAYKPGYVPQRILIRPPAELSKGTGKKYGLRIDFLLFRMKLGEDYTFWRDPIRKYYFRNREDGFVRDDVFEAYMQVKIKDELIRIGEYYPEAPKMEH